eukprot:jgi/Hompol1/6538/HPOL_000191-RA
MSQRKLGGFEFYRHVLKSPKYVVAPMVEQSEYAWRVLSRRYGAQLCYTPMFHAKLFSENAKYRQENFQTDAADRPLIVQFCANDPDTLLAAAKLVEHDCDAVDLNLGCPQGIAKRGHYGSFLQDEWDLIASMVRKLHDHLAIPVTCKIRVFPDVEKTVAYAKMLRDAGCQLLTVHGRLREQKGQKTGLADWTQIKRVKEALDIPVFANGNILYFEDIDRCIRETGVDGVMTAEGNLYNPAIFTGRHPHSCDVALEYLDICKTNAENTVSGDAKAHVFKMLHASLVKHPDLRTRLGTSHTLEDFTNIVIEMKSRLQSEVVDFDVATAPVDERGIKMIPHWLLQPYIRPPDRLAENVAAQQEKQAAESTLSKPTDVPTDAVEASDKPVLSKKAAKRKARETAVASASSTTTTTVGESETNNDDTGNNGGKRGRRIGLCVKCTNVGSAKCEFKMCKACCRAHVAAGNTATATSDSQPDTLPTQRQYVCESHRSAFPAAAAAPATTDTPVLASA